MNLLEKYIKYFSGTQYDIDFENSFHLKSGSLAENAVQEICLLNYCKKQSVNNNFRFDFESNHIIYEVKNYLFNSQGTADEKLLYSCWKYMNFKKDIIIILCANMEIKFEKQLEIFIKSNNLYNLLENNIFITRLSDIITEKVIFNIFNKDSNIMFKWVGSKQSISYKIISKINEIIDNKSNEYTYIEPFVGSCSILKSLINNNIKFKKYIINDSNKCIISLLKILQDKQSNKIINELKNYEEYYNSLDNQSQEDFYYNIRDDFNKLLINDNVDNIDLVSTFLFINKTCFRGLFRVNKKNIFNVPYGNYHKINFDYDSLIEFENILKNNQNIEISCLDYNDFLNNSLKNDKYFIYLDPPYENTFDSYCQKRFDNDSFKSKCIELSKHESYKLLISNSKDFELEGFQYKLIEIQQKINSKMPDSKRIEKILYK